MSKALGYNISTTIHKDLNIGLIHKIIQIVAHFPPKFLQNRKRIAKFQTMMQSPFIFSDTIDNLSSNYNFLQYFSLIFFLYKCLILHSSLFFLCIICYHSFQLKLFLVLDKALYGELLSFTFSSYRVYCIHRFSSSVICYHSFQALSGPI